MVKKFSCFLMLLFSINAFLKAQLFENFSDGDFHNNPKWTGHTDDFLINDHFQLQSKNEEVNSTFYLSTKNTQATQTEWKFWLRMAFNPSSVNYVDTWLIASAEDLTANSTSGYFVRSGGTEDEISLYRKDGDGAITKIIQGNTQVLNRSNNSLRIRITRDKNNIWTLFTDINGMGDHYILQGSVQDEVMTTSGFFGFLVKQSTSGFFSKHYFDDIEIGTFVPDEEPPAILSLTVLSEKMVQVQFNEPLNKKTGEDRTKYFLSHGMGLPESALLDVQNPALVNLTFSTDFADGTRYNLIISGVEDLYGNILQNGTGTFSYYSPGPYDVVISEVFPDPSPEVGLPPLKFLELRNTTSHPVNLLNWTLSENNRIAVLPAFHLLPDSFVIITTSASVSAYLPYGKTLGVANFPNLNINGSAVILRTANGSLMHAMEYNLSSYKNELKKSGGWTLEMIDVKNPCGGAANYTASVHPRGGTPGIINSVDGSRTDEDGPELIHGFARDANTIMLKFNESLDSLSAASTAHYMINNNLLPISAEVVPPFFDQVMLHLPVALEGNKIHTVLVKNITDCQGNFISDKNKVRVGLAEIPGEMDVIVNEILFDPPPMGVDYVELYNRSDKIIDLNQLYLANRNNRDEISSIQQISTGNRLLFPGDFIALSVDPDIVKRQFITTNPEAFLKMNTLPSYPNSGGNVIILNNQGEIVDEIKYTDKWHFPLVKNPKGVALERISYEGPSTASNFHSAASSAGFGTPGYKNSQHLVQHEIKGEITIEPSIFSPDNDGTDDLLTIHYQFPTPGYVTNITIFDASGRKIKYLQKNALSGLTGYYRWDGLDDQKRKLPQGIYIIYTEIFNVNGQKKRFKNTVVLARRRG